MLLALQNVVLHKIYCYCAHSIVKPSFHKEEPWAISLENISCSIAILLQGPVYCFWRADFHGQGATLVTPDNLMYSLPTILPPL
jgi:hypothetical protein